MIEVEHLTKWYREPRRRTAAPTRREAVQDLSFRVAGGQIYALLGPNGAGKTTTLRMIATTLRPSSGTARVCGHDLRQHPREVRRSIGFLTGNTDLYGRLKVSEVLRYFGALYGIEGPELGRRIEELATTFGMTEFVDKRCDKLSSGMKQKVSIARSVIHDPPVMILDEPTAMLDVITSRAIVTFIQGCRSRGKVVLLSTHDMAEATKLADQIGVLHQGRMLAEGAPRELMARTGTLDLEEAFLSLVGASGT
jgi:sodium transport system ATP-binding protein